MKVSIAETNSSLAELALRNDKNEQHGIFKNKVRYAVLALTTICLTLGMCNATALHFTVICMKCETKMDGNSSNSTINTDPQQSMFTFKQESWLFAALYAGTLICGLALDLLCNLIGVRAVITLFGLASGLAMFGTPIGALYLPAPANFYALLVARFLQGFALTLGFVVGDLLTKWSPIAETTLFIGIVSTNFTIGRTIMMFIAGFLCESFLGWPSIYYIFGTLTLAFHLLFYWFYREYPQKHWKVAAAELAHIQLGKEQIGNEKVVPKDKGKYIELLTNPHVWAVIVSNIGLNLGSQLLAQFGPTFLKKAVHLSTQQSGYIASLSYLGSAVVATIVSRACDRLKCLKGNVKLILIVTTTFIHYALAICYLALSFVPLSMPILIQCLYILTICFLGIWLCPSRSQRLIAMNTTVYYFYVTLVPSYVNFFISESDVTDIGKWNRLFQITAGTLVISGIISQVSIQIAKKQN